MFAVTRIGRTLMTVNAWGPIQRAPTTTESNVDINKLRVLIAEDLEVEVRHVTDDAHLSRDLGADWLDRLELIILVEEIAGVEITDNEADQIEVVGDLVNYNWPCLRSAFWLLGAMRPSLHFYPPLVEPDARMSRLPLRPASS
jgi:acyl carrier protein